MHEKLAKYLIENEITISFAESISGGMLASKLVETPGISSVLLGSIVCYNRSVKENLLGISKDLLDKYSCESHESSNAIAYAVKKLIPADLVVGITGLASSGGSESKDKPVGSIFLCVLYKGQQFEYKSILTGTRKEIRENTCLFTFSKVYQLLSST